VTRKENTMIETPRQYTERILGYVEGQDPLVVQAATAARLAQLIDGCPVDALRRRPAPDKWSVGEVIAHLADGEIVGGYRIRLILGSPGVAVPAYDQERWVTSGHYDQRDPRKSLDVFRVLRDNNLDLLRSLDSEQWTLSGVHSERGHETIEHIVRMFAAHDLNHLRQIEDMVARR
jgi:hypothetical protein